MLSITYKSVWQRPQIMEKHGVHVNYKCSGAFFTPVEKKAVYIYLKKISNFSYLFRLLINRLAYLSDTSKFPYANYSSLETRLQSS